MTRDGEAELLAQVYAAPDDDAPRLVYADWLQQRGDPRGEFIALQIDIAGSKRAPKGARAREKELLDNHIAEWVAPLNLGGLPPDDGWENRVTFERGFPAKTWAHGINLDPSWSTVTHCNRPPHDDQCHVGALRAVTGAFNEDIVALSKLTKPLRVEELVWEYVSPGLGAYVGFHDHLQPTREIEALAEIRVLAKLRRFAAAPEIVGAWPKPEHCTWMWKGPFAATLEEVVVPQGRDAGAWIAALAGTRLRKFELVRGASNLDSWRAGVHLVFERDGRGGFGALTAVAKRAAASTLDGVSHIVEHLDAGVLSSVRVAIASKADWRKTKPQRKRLEQAFAARRIAGTIEQAAS